MTKANLDVRERAKAAGVYIYQLARAIGVSEPTMTRKLRYELPEKDKQQIFNAIDSIKAEQEAGAVV